GIDKVLGRIGRSRSQIQRVGGQECRFFLRLSDRWIAQSGQRGEGPVICCVQIGGYVQIQAENQGVRDAVQRRQIWTDEDSLISPLGSSQHDGAVSLQGWAQEQDCQDGDGG